MASAPNLTLFLKPILSDSLRLRDKLMIPLEFVMKYGGDVLPDTAFLKLPNGAEWEVNLEKRDGDQVWFVKGWKEFAEYYSLYDGRLLVFGYDHSTSRFHVLIFDLMTSLEIQYPSIGNTQSEASFEKGPLGTNDDSVLPCLQQCKRKRVIDEEGGQEVDNAFNSQENDLHHSTKKFKGDRQGMFDSNFLKSKVVKGNSALERANAFKSKYPSFVWVAKRSYIHGSSNFSIPSNFAKSFLGSKKNGENTNLMLDGRVWVAKYIIRKHCTRIMFELSCAGFRALAKANDLKVGDVCVFELMGERTITFQVLIFRNNDDSNTHTQGQSREANTEEQSKRRVEIKTEITCSDNEAFEIFKTLQLPPRNAKFTKSKISEGAAFDNFNSQNPFFQITIGKSHSQEEEKMVRSPFYDKKGVKKGAWSREEDDKLRDYIQRYGHSNWCQLPKSAGLARCGKSCRLRWMNYLRPNLKLGNFTNEEGELIIKLHQKHGNKWSLIAEKLPGRTDNDIKNHWNSHLKKSLKLNEHRDRVWKQGES